jgi:RNA polymerase sigma-70 factor (ECF subfamily)
VLAAAALNRLCQIYRASIVRWFEQARLTHADAEDATQEFLMHVFGGPRLNGFVRGKRRFRSWLVACLRNFATDTYRAAKSVRRGGGVPHEDIARVNPPAPLWPPDAMLDRDLAVEIHRQAVADLRRDWDEAREGRAFELLTPFLLETPGPGEYARIGRLLDLSPERIKRRVFDLREQYFDQFRARVAASVEPTELADELKYFAALLAADPPAAER